MINYDGKKCQLEVKGTLIDIISELLAIIKSIEIQLDENERRMLRSKIIDALYNANLTKMAEECIKDIKEG